MNITVTGSNGFIAKNFISRVKYEKIKNIFKITKKTKKKNIIFYLKNSEYIFHFAGSNRPKKKSDFNKSNYLFTKTLCNLLKLIDKKPKIIFTSSAQVGKKNFYALSKAKAEKELLQLSKKNGNKIYILRLPNIFGKWSKPNYNSFIATLCHNYINKKKSKLINKNKKFEIIYIDDLINYLISILKNKVKLSKINKKFNFSYFTTINQIDKTIKYFNNCRKSFLSDFSNSLTKKLYSTYLSFLQKKDFSYKLKKFSDDRGDFVEFLKMNSYGQISFFTIKKNKSRGGHFHHTKVEKFLVINGKAKFQMQDLYNNKNYVKILDSKHPQVIESIPGMSHSITNIGNKITKVMLWTNEVYDKKFPDTYN